MTEAEPRDAHMWLPPDQQEEWIAAKHSTATLTFASFVAFNLLSWASLRIVNRSKRIKDPGNQALIRYGITSATHALLSLFASFYLMMRRDVGHCGERPFCHDDLSARLWTVHAGYCLYEFLFWQNVSALVQPWTDMLLLHDVICLLMALASLMYPARLSLTLLPLHQLLQLATLVDAVRRLLSVYGAPWHARFKAYLAFMVAYGAKALGGVALVPYTFFWIRSNRLWTLELPEGMSVLNSVYGIIFLAGGVIQAMIYVKWAAGAVALTNTLISSIQAAEKQVAGSAKPAAGGIKAGGRKKERQRR